MSGCTTTIISSPPSMLDCPGNNTVQFTQVLTVDDCAEKACINSGTGFVYDPAINMCFVKNGTCTPEPGTVPVYIGAVKSNSGIKWSCSNNVCTQDQNGLYSTQADCINACSSVPNTTYNCVNQQCLPVTSPATGSYQTLDECNKACTIVPPVPGISYDCLSGSCSKRTDTNGQYTSLLDCNANCHSGGGGSKSSKDKLIIAIVVPVVIVVVLALGLGLGLGLKKRTV